MLPSLKVPVAVNCWLVPRLRVGFSGVIAMETREALFTFTTAEPMMELRRTEILVHPALMPVT